MQEWFFQQTDTVLGRNTASVFLDNLKNQIGYLGTLFKKCLCCQGLRLENIEMYISVADMTEPDYLEIGIGRTDQTIDLL